ncbi:MAG: hypothetical protein J6T44_10005 [Prevotella sp.]|nr:hypothetical protein [Prevotella sp.]MBO7539603.1 hypothetical protein [Prevotella sp.]
MNNKVLSLITAMVLALSTSAASFETDRTWYLAGEAMKVSVTVDDALIAYAELCDTHGLAAGVVISLKGGEGTGIIELPSDLHSGYYVLSVYTRHNAQVSHRLIAVVNPLHKYEDDDIKWVLDDSCWTNQTAEPNLISQKDIDVRETEGHIIKARVKNVYDGNTFRANQIRPSLSIVGKQIHYFEGKMVNDSIAVFYTYGIHGKQPLVLSATSFTGVSLPIEMISPFATFLPKELPHLEFHYKRSEVEARSIDMQRHQVSKEGSSENQATGVPLDYDETVFGTKPDLTYNLNEYRQFLTIREVLLEYVSCVMKKKNNGVTQLFVRNKQNPYNSSWPAMVLIDGMPVNDIERLLNYDARRIHYINIYGSQYTFGNGVYNGILSFITRSGQLTNYPTEPNVQYLVYDFPE